MSFDITDAYENIKQLRGEVDTLILRQEFIIDLLKKEGMYDEKELEKFAKKMEGKQDGK